jgi:hypothetical protein
MGAESWWGGPLACVGRSLANHVTGKKARSSYRLLILDGYGSHLTMHFIEYRHQNKILMVVFPPIQPTAFSH